MSNIQPIVVPKWGMEMEEGTISEWHVEEGAPIRKGDELVDIETSKIVNTLESNCSGILRRRVAKAGTTLPVGALLGVCAENDVADADIESFVASYVGQLEQVDQGNQQETRLPTGTLCNETVKASPSARKLAKEMGIDLSTIKATGPRGRISKEDVINAGKTPQQTPADAEVKISPVAKRLAKKLGVDISKVKGTGAHGRISKEDIEKAAGMEAQPETQKVAESVADYQGYSDYPVSATRKTIAKRLVEAKQSIPHFYLTVKCQADSLLGFREQLNGSQDIKVSINDILIKAAGLALQDIPTVNSQYNDGFIRQFSASHIALAVATEKGVLTPIIRDVHCKGLGQIARESKTLSQKAQAGQLTLDDLSGGTFSISNLGMFGIEEFSAVINPPQAAILAIGSIQQVSAIKNGAVEAYSQLKVTLSCDHRVIDGVDGAKWLQRFKSYIEAPATMLL